MVEPTVIEIPKKPVDPEPEEPRAENDAKLVEADLLVEDVSIDGMCGVY